MAPHGLRVRNFSDTTGWGMSLVTRTPIKMSLGSKSHVPTKALPYTGLESHHRGPCRASRPPSCSVTPHRIHNPRVTGRLFSLFRHPPQKNYGFRGRGRLSSHTPFSPTPIVWPVDPPVSFGRARQSGPYTHGRRSTVDTSPGPPCGSWRMRPWLGGISLDRSSPMNSKLRAAGWHGHEGGVVSGAPAAPVAGTSCV